MMTDLSSLLPKLNSSMSREQKTQPCRLEILTFKEAKCPQWENDVNTLILVSWPLHASDIVPRAKERGSLEFPFCIGSAWA